MQPDRVNRGITSPSTDRGSKTFRKALGPWRLMVWSFDGRSRPNVAIDTRAAWVNGLADGLVLVSEDDAKLYRAGTLVDLDLVL